MARSVQIAVMPTTQTNRSWGRAELNPPRVYALRERCNEDRYVLFSCRECIEHSRFHGIGCHWHKPWSQRSVPVLVSEWIRDLLLWCVGTSVVERLVPCLALSPCPILHIGSIGWCDSNGDCLPHDTRVSSEWRAVLAESPATQRLPEIRIGSVLATIHQQTCRNSTRRRYGLYFGK